MRIQGLFLSAFAAPRKSLRPSSVAAVPFGTRLSASFLGDLTKSFSSTSGSGTDYFTVGITGSSGCVGNALLNELGKREAVNGKVSGSCTYQAH